MPLDPGAAAFLKFRESLLLPDVKNSHSLIRKAGHADKDISGPIDNSVLIEHRFITTPTADVPIRIYRPALDSELRGCLVFFHGGGWVVGNIDRYDAQLSQISRKANTVVVSVNYQKAPENSFPIPFDDCFTTLEWVFENAENLKIDTTKIGVAGDSAGGNLAAAVALKARDEGNIELSYQILLYPCLSLDFESNSFREYSDGYGLTRENMMWFWQKYIDFEKDSLNPYAVPASAKSLSGVAPAIVVTAEFDPLTDDSRSYIQRLEQEKVEVSYLHLNGMIHGVFNQYKFVPQATELMDYLVFEILKKNSR
jgi:acetyl esterase